MAVVMILTCEWLRFGLNVRYSASGSLIGVVPAMDTHPTSKQRNVRAQRPTPLGARGESERKHHGSIDKLWCAAEIYT